MLLCDYLSKRNPSLFVGDIIWFVAIAVVVTSPEVSLNVFISRQVSIHLFFRFLFPSLKIYRGTQCNLLWRLSVSPPINVHRLINFPNIWALRNLCKCVCTFLMYQDMEYVICLHRTSISNKFHHTPYSINILSLARMVKNEKL